MYVRSYLLYRDIIFAIQRHQSHSYTGYCILQTIYNRNNSPRTIPDTNAHSQWARDMANCQTVNCQFDNSVAIALISTAASANIRQVIGTPLFMLNSPAVYPPTHSRSLAVTWRCCSRLAVNASETLQSRQVDCKNH